MAGCLVCRCNQQHGSCNTMVGDHASANNSNVCVNIATRTASM